MAAITVNDDVRQDSPWMTPIVVFCGFLIFAAIALHPTAWTMAEIWARSSSYHHGFAVAPIAVWMILSQNRLDSPTPASGLSYAIAAIGAAGWLLGAAAGVSLVEQAALITVIIGGTGLVFGGAALRHWAYPLCFLYFMAPFGEVLTPSLQAITAESITTIISLVGGDAALSGNIISVNGMRFEIAEACAGLRFLLAAVMIAAAVGYVSFPSLWKRLFFIAAAAILAIVANGARALLLILSGASTNGDWLIGQGHALIGWAFYACALYLLIYLGRKLSDSAPLPERPLPINQTQPSPILSILPALALLIAVSLYNKTIIEQTPQTTAPSSLSLINAPGWRILPPPQNWRPDFPAADRYAGATYQSTDHTVYLTIAFYTHDRRGAEIINELNSPWNEDYWRMQGRYNDSAALFDGAQNQTYALLTGPDHRKLAVTTIYWFGDDIYLKPWRLKLAQMKAKLSGRHYAGGALMVAAAYNHSPEEAVEAFHAFSVSIEPLNDWRLRNNGG